MFYDTMLITSIISLILTLVIFVIALVIHTLYLKWIVRSELEKFLQKHPEILRKY